MSLKKEIDNAVRRIIAINNKKDSLTLPENQEQIIQKTLDAFSNSKVDFGKITSVILTQNKKKRLIKHYDNPYSPESILCQCIKQILDKSFKIKFPNRNMISHNFFSIISSIISMDNFTIVKFDFKNYFNSVSSIYVFNKYLRNNLLNREEIDLIDSFVNSTKYAYAGLCTSNTIAEIIAKYFDSAICKHFKAMGMIFYERYIDDCILVLNNFIEEESIKKQLESIILEIFHDKAIDCGQCKCKTRLNYEKFRYISKDVILSKKGSIDFLGYEFWFEKAKNDKINIQYGITSAKQEKYNSRLDKMIASYKNDSSGNKEKAELLRHRIAAFSSREVYLSKCFNSNIWRVKGFISNYEELRVFLETDKLEKHTEKFLLNAIEEAFDRAGLEKPYFLQCKNIGNKDNKNNKNCGYNLFYNMKSNKTILLVPNIGYDYKSLANLCEQIGIANKDVNGKKRNYTSLVRDYLIKVNVGY